jgi:hypothetical protein
MRTTISFKNRFTDFSKSKENIMSQIIHCCILLYIVFVIAEIRSVLVHSDPQQAEPIAIWEEILQPPVEGSFKITFRP